ncbi:HD domain-containing protein [Bacteroidota bacterium]
MSLLDTSIEFVQSRLSGVDAGHDWTHIERVLALARHIQGSEQKGDLEIIELAVIFHDIADTKFHEGSENDGGNIAFTYLREKRYPAEKAEQIRDIINSISYKHSFENKPGQSIEFQIVQDADRLDAMGAIGIARAFSYGGFKQREMYNPDIPPKEYMNTEEYKKSSSPTINHFYEKLFKLKDLMNTETGKRLAAERHVYMVEFIKRFKEEWEGNT